MDQPVIDDLQLLKMMATALAISAKASPYMTSEGDVVAQKSAEMAMQIYKACNAEWQKAVDAEEIV